jgi:DNA-binding transcriptional LysR family regulator
MIDQLEGRYVRTFIAVLEELSFSRAADKLGYVQSTVTAHIQLLEQACRRKLFHRLARGVKPTEAGLKFAGFAYRFVQLGLSLEETLNEANEPQGLVRVRMQESLFVTRLAAPMRAFLQRYPHIRVVPETGFQPDIVRQVLDHTVDIGFVPQDPERSELTFHPLIVESLVFVAAEPLAERATKDGPEALSRETFLCFGASCLYNTHAHQLLAAHRVQVPRVIELPSMEMVRQSVLCGLGYALLPQFAVSEELEQGLFRNVPLGGPIPITHGLIVHKEHEQTHAAQLLIRHMIDAFHPSQPGR